MNDKVFRVGFGIGLAAVSSVFFYLDKLDPKLWIAVLVLAAAIAFASTVKGLVSTALEAYKTWKGKGQGSPGQGDP